MDQRLRKRGFAIYARPDKGLPRWSRDGRVYCQREASEITEKEMDKAIHDKIAETKIKK